ncbi:hypothetical protein Hanom_Chr06g00571911 [Helianthus anomalus]
MSTVQPKSVASVALPCGLNRRLLRHNLHRHIPAGMQLQSLHFRKCCCPIFQSRCGGTFRRKNDV